MFNILGDTYNATAVCAILLFKHEDEPYFQVVLYGAASDDYIEYDEDEEGNEFDVATVVEEYNKAVAAWAKAAGHEVPS